MLEEAARWAVALRESVLPDDALHHAKRALLDWMAATVVGGVMPPAQILGQTLVPVGDGGPATLIPSGRRVDVRTAALINGTAAHTAEVDDIFRDGVYHPGAPTIAAALAAAQAHRCSGPELLAGIVAGYEISTRIAARMQPSHYRYWHTTGTVGTLGAAAAVGTIIGLDDTALAHAVATATTMAAGLQQAFRSDAMSKPLHAGHAADAGTLAALSAAGGFTGALDVIDGAAGFGAAMSDAPDWSGLYADLGQAFTITEMTFKNHSCCGHTFAAIDGALRLRAEHGLAAEDVEAIEVATYRTAVEVAGNPAPRTAFEAKFSIPYVVAAAITLGSVRLAAFRDERLADPTLRRLVDRTTVTVDPELDASFPGQRGARVRITTRQGDRLETLMPTRRGDPDLPLTDDELQDKFTELVEPQLGPDRTTVLADQLWSLESVADLADVLTPAAEAVG